MKIYKLILIVAVAITPSIVNAQNTSGEEAIRAVLDMQSKAWNRGDIDEYMKGYWDSDSLVFIGKNGPKYGYKTTLENYKKGYPDAAAMGKLDFELLQVKRLSALYYHVTGKWHLDRSIGELQGYFTLLFRKIKNKWVIVSDHSS
jgi:ketosteroid isomerase-like protein